MDRILYGSFALEICSARTRLGVLNRRYDRTLVHSQLYKRFKTYVANRLSIIHDGSTSGQ